MKVSKNTFKQNYYCNALKLIKKLQECSTIGQADPILTKLGAGPAVKKLVETAIILSNSQDPQQRSHAFQFMESAIKEMEDPKEEKEYDAEINEMDDDENDDKPIHEEVLDNNNNGSREDGSEGSSDNTEPYPGTASTEPHAEGMDDSTGENQWNETGPGMIVPGLPPTTPGLAPDVAQEMGMGMPKMPPMDTNQMMRQMQYTVNKVVSDLYKKEIAPLRRGFNQQREAIKNQNKTIRLLSQELRETKVSSGNLKFDLDHMRQNKNASFRETTMPLIGDSQFAGQPMSGVQPPTTRKKDQLERERQSVTEMNRILNAKRNPIYQ